MPVVTVLQPPDNLLVSPDQPLLVSGHATDKGLPEPLQVRSVTVRIDGGVPIEADLTGIPHQKLTTVRFSASVQVVGEGPHTVTVTATNDQGTSASKVIGVLVAAASCVYPQSNPTTRPVMEELRAVAENSDRCSSLYLDTLERHSNDGITTFEGEEHHQGLARTHQLSDGSIFFFLSHSEMDPGDKGNLMQFRYPGPTEGEHLVTTSPMTVASLVQLLEIEEQHPCDLAFLPDVNGADAGYLFVAEQYRRQLGVYRWAPSGAFVFQGAIAQEFPTGGPNHVFLDRVGDHYLLGIGNGDAGSKLVALYHAEPSALFRGCLPGAMDVAAFQPSAPEHVVPFPVSEFASQVHLLRDGSGAWFLLAFRSDPPDQEFARNFVDVHAVELTPFSVSPLLATHELFLHPRVNFASTGTHYVDRSGRLLISSSYRWSQDEGPGEAGYVSRVDECSP